MPQQRGGGGAAAAARPVHAIVPGSGGVGRMGGTAWHGHVAAKDVRENGRTGPVCKTTERGGEDCGRGTESQKKGQTRQEKGEDPDASAPPKRCLHAEGMASLGTDAQPSVHQNTTVASQ
uniref:Uncharacterized protein n=1 Tax=Eutreptiella gymnastica TaxID=73025 RepID=A0A7S4D2V9_9EUGL|mmetsp:Transcript_71306/g.119359  ORF Transcript_71306/g.119359 Transcript_71306/m.119359 type:complete len:120 (+) Transcript_71306:70-429(+)